MQSERDQAVFLKDVKVVLTRIEEVFKNWQDKLQRNVASRSSEYHGSIHGNVQFLARRKRNILRVQMVSTLRILNIEQQQCIELEREKSKKSADKLKNMVCWLTKCEDHYKVSLDNLEKENKDLRRDLLDMQRERDRAELANNAKVSKLQDEIELLRTQIAQLRNEHKQLILQNEQYKDENFKQKHLLENVTATSFRRQNVARKSKMRIIEKHPALTDKDEGQKTNKLPELKVHKITNKRRKLFQEDNDAVIDII